MDMLISDNAQIQDLVARLGDENGLVRQHARLTLTHLEAQSLPGLMETLHSPNRNARWEAVKALGEIRAPQSAAALAVMLEDDDIGIRWAAMESLSKLGRACLFPMLELFVKNFDSSRMREGVHHILHILRDRGLLNRSEITLFEKLSKHYVLGFENGLSPEAAWAAEKALEELDRAAIFEDTQ